MYVPVHLARPPKTDHVHTNIQTDRLARFHGSVPPTHNADGVLIRMHTGARQAPDARRYVDSNARRHTAKQSVLLSLLCSGAGELSWLTGSDLQSGPGGPRGIATHRSEVRLSSATATLRDHKYCKVPIAQYPVPSAQCPVPSARKGRCSGSDS
jgi:hypothetical protein